MTETSLVTPVPPAGDVEVLAVVALGGYFSSEELGDIDIQPRMAALEQIQQDVVRTDADEHLELVDRAHVARLQAEVSALQQRLNIADQRVSDLQAEVAKLRRGHCELIYGDELPNQGIPGNSFQRLNALANEGE